MLSIWKPRRIWKFFADTFLLCTLATTTESPSCTNANAKSRSKNLGQKEACARIDDQTRHLAPFRRKIQVGKGDTGGQFSRALELGNEIIVIRPSLIVSEELFLLGQGQRFPGHELTENGIVPPSDDLRRIVQPDLAEDQVVSFRKPFEILSLRCKRVRTRQL
ncbi:hypothetical protein ACVWZV_007115 [Bradyrhizobium sp. GM5.1]